VEKARVSGRCRSDTHRPLCTIRNASYFFSETREGHSLFCSQSLASNISSIMPSLHTSFLRVPKLTMEGRDINRHDIFKTREVNFVQIFHSPSMLHTLWFKISQFLN
jgi:hypothetical protein